MTRIAIISVHECPLASSEGKERGGLNVYVFELSKALARIGWEVDIYTRQQDDINPIIVQVSSRLRVIHIACGPHTPLSKSKIIENLDEFAHGVQDYIKNNTRNYDIVHAHYYLSGIVAQKLHVPWVITFHTLGLMKQLVSRSFVAEDPPERIPMELALAQSTEKIITTSANESNYVEALYNVPKNRIATSTPGVDRTVFFPKDKIQSKKTIGADPHHHIILAVGRIDPVKGFDVLLYAIKILFAKYPKLANQTCVWIVGGDIGENESMWSSELKKLTNLQHHLGLHSTVKFIPPQPQEKLVDYYNAADVVVMPSHYESFGMVALEALACDTQVITTDVMGISPLLKEFPQGHVVSANNPILLADQLHQALSNKTTNKTNPSSLHAFEWNTVASKMNEIYAEVIQKSLKLRNVCCKSRKI